jgi:phthalate 4,5-dioxygenase oxygenase subunit
MLNHAENDLLTRIGPDAPMGQMMRRHWMPACMSEEVAEPGGAPVRVELLGERLVAFRDTSGRVGLLEERCPHRRASLVLARNEDCGLRCLYHGWKLDVDGAVVDMPSEPEDSPLRGRVRTRAYPVHESDGFVWAYLGPPEEMPAFTPPPWAGKEVRIAKIHQACNWAQSLEGAIDSSHSSALHSSTIRAGGSGERTVAIDGADITVLSRPSIDKAPRIQIQVTSYGFRYAAIRRPTSKADTHDYVRITVFVAPCFAVIPPNAHYTLNQLHVPLDDENTMFYAVAAGEGLTFDQDFWRRRQGARVGIDLDRNYRKIRTIENNYLQDRERMKAGDFSGIEGVPAQDMAMQETMGPIVDRSRETLGASDIAIVRFRQLMIDSARRFAAGEPALGTAEPRLPLTEIRSFEGIVPKETDWRTLAVTPREIEGYRRLHAPSRVA